jgi:phage shock protein PspC (stress-responsive transcriptional regulator)
LTERNEPQADALGHGHRRARRPAAAAPLARSDKRVVAGVAAGVAEFVGADPRAVRWLWAITLPLSGGLTAVAYLALWAMLPGPDRWDAAGATGDRVSRAATGDRVSRAATGDRVSRAAAGDRANRGA